jgi:hypothetical protein
MKILMKPIDMIAYFTKDGIPHPIKYRINFEKDLIEIIKIDKVIWSETENLAGNKTIIFSCQSIINNIEKRYELKYEIETCRWFLYKI